MALTLASDTADVIGLDEYIDFCDSELDPRDREQAIASAGKLKALANDKRFLVAYLNSEMKDLDRFQAVNDFKPPTFMLHRGAGYTVRAVVWLPAGEIENPELFSYYETHDHNFDFVTCGYHGSGYHTTIFQYDPDRVVGYPGEKVVLDFLEETTLPDGKLMYYRASRDVHTQLPPDEFSISLNLILPKVRERREAQYEFDADTHSVNSRFVDLQMRRTIFAAVRHVGDGNSLDILATLARRHSDPRTRALAWETLIAARPDEAGGFLDTAMDDASPYVREMARRACEAAG